MSGRHLYVPPHCVVFNVLATFASSVVRILMEPEVGCPTIFVKMASQKVFFTVELIDTVVLLGIFALFRRLTSSGAFWIGYRLSSRAFLIVYLIFWAATSSDRRERMEDLASTTVFGSRLVFRIGSFDQVSGDFAAALWGEVGSLDRISGDSAVVLRSWFCNRLSQLGQRRLRCCAAGGDDGFGRTGADGRSHGID